MVEASLNPDHLTPMSMSNSEKQAAPRLIKIWVNLEVFSRLDLGSQIVNNLVSESRTGALRCNRPSIIDYRKG